METKRQWPTSFPFLSLPCELQAEVVRHVGDIRALRDLLAIPQVARSVAPFVRLVTNTPLPMWFDGLEKEVPHSQVPMWLGGRGKEEVPHLGSHDGDKGTLVYILDLFLVPSFDTTPYTSLRNCIVVFSVERLDHPNFESECGDTLHKLSKIIRPQTFGVVGVGDSPPCITIEDGKPILANNLTFGNLQSVSISEDFTQLPMRESLAQNVMGFGWLSSFRIDDIPESTSARNVRRVLKKYKELINNTQSFRMEDPDCYQRRIDRCDFSHMRGLYKFNCCQFTNVRINTAYTDDNPGMFRKGELWLCTVCSEKEGTEKGDAPALIGNIVAPGLVKLTINCVGTQFPVLKSLWFPHLEILNLMGCFQHAPHRIEFDHLCAEEIQEISKLLYVAKEVQFDQFTAPLIGLALPSSFNNTTHLTLIDSIMTIEGIEEELAKDLVKLKIQHGKIRMPMLKELRWCCMLETNRRTLDFKQLSQWFMLAHLEKLVFETVNECVSLNAIAEQVPRIKELNVRLPEEARDHIVSALIPRVEKVLYPSPGRDLTSATFERLEKLIIHTGYHQGIFYGTPFPHLKSVELRMKVNFLESDYYLEADMPVLEVLLVTATSRYPIRRQNVFNINGFRNLKKVVLESDVYKEIWLKQCLKLEHLIHTGGGLTEINAFNCDDLPKLRTLKYTSLDGRACHRFEVSPSVEVDVRCVGSRGPAR